MDAPRRYRLWRSFLRPLGFSVLLVSMLIPLMGPSCNEATGPQCSDGVDNDGDGNIDCGPPPDDGCVEAGHCGLKAIIEAATASTAVRRRFNA